MPPITQLSDHIVQGCVAFAHLILFIGVAYTYWRRQKEPRSGALLPIAAFLFASYCYETLREPPYPPTGLSALNILATTAMVVVVAKVAELPSPKLQLAVDITDLKTVEQRQQETINRLRNQLSIIELTQRRHCARTETEAECALQKSIDRLREIANEPRLENHS